MSIGDAKIRADHAAHPFERPVDTRFPSPLAYDTEDRMREPWTYMLDPRYAVALTPDGWDVIGRVAPPLTAARRRGYTIIRPFN